MVGFAIILLSLFIIFDILALVVAFFSDNLNVPITTKVFLWFMFATDIFIMYLVTQML